MDNITTKLGKAFTQLATGSDESPILRRALFQSIAEDFAGMEEGWASPTGTAITTTFNADATTVVSNPPTQAQVQAINDRLKETRQLLKSVIDNLF